MDWANHDEMKRQPFLLSFLEKINLNEVAPQVLIEVIQHPIISSSPVVEKLMRDSLTNVLSKKFDSVEPIDVEEQTSFTHKTPLRCFYQQDVC
jgi:hypothetical protein